MNTDSNHSLSCTLGKTEYCIDFSGPCNLWVHLQIYQPTVGGGVYNNHQIKHAQKNIALVHNWFIILFHGWKINIDQLYCPSWKTMALGSFLPKKIPLPSQALSIFKFILSYIVVENSIWSQQNNFWSVKNISKVYISMQYKPCIISLWPIYVHLRYFFMT